MKSSKSATYKGIKHLRKDKQLREELSKYYKNSIGTDDLKISQFPKYVRELDLRNFLFKVGSIGTLSFDKRFGLFITSTFNFLAIFAIFLSSVETIIRVIKREFFAAFTV